MMVFKFIKKFFKAIYLTPRGIKVGVTNTQSGRLMVDGKYQQALDKIAWLDNEVLRGCIGLRKASIHALLNNHQSVIDITSELIPYFEKTKYYKQHDKDYLLFTTKMDMFRNYREMGVKQPELLQELEIMSEKLDLSKIDKRLMKDFPERSLKGWYKHNSKDEYYEQTIARYGEE